MIFICAYVFGSLTRIYFSVLTSIIYCIQTVPIETILLNKSSISMAVDTDPLSSTVP